MHESKIKTARILLGLTMSEFATLLSIPEHYLRKLETGHAVTPVKMLESVALLFRQRQEQLEQFAKNELGTFSELGDFLTYEVFENTLSVKPQQKPVLSHSLNEAKVYTLSKSESHHVTVHLHDFGPENRVPVTTTRIDKSQRPGFRFDDPRTW